MHVNAVRLLGALRLPSLVTGIVGLVTIALDHVLGWWVWLFGVVTGLALIAWPLLGGPRPRPLAGRRVRLEQVDQVVAPAVP